MSHKNEEVIESAASNKQSKAILSAFLFLEDVGEQVEALRKTIKTQIKESSHCSELKIKVGSFNEDYESTNSVWLVRSQIDRFQILNAKKTGPRGLMIGAIQISLAPSRTQANEEFFPNVAILLGAESDWDNWDCEEFELDSEFLTKIKKDDEVQWKPAGTYRWEAQHGELAVAFVVPLVDLHSDRDTKTKVVDKLFAEVGNMLKKLEK